MSLSLTELESLISRSRARAERLAKVEARPEAAMYVYADLARLELEYAMKVEPDLRQQALMSAMNSFDEAYQIGFDLPNGHKDRQPVPDDRTTTDKLVQELELEGLAEAAEAVRLARYYTAIRLVVAEMKREAAGADKPSGQGEPSLP